MQQIFKRSISLFLVCLLLVFPVSAEGETASHPFQELRPQPPFEINVSWTEMPIRIQSGGNTLRGVLTCPKDISEEMPVAILLHGLATDLHWCDDIAWCLADHGIISVRFDFNGNGESDGAQEDMTISSEVQDTIAILDYVKTLKFTDADHIFMVGKSMGAVAAVMAAQERPGEVTAMCLWYPGFGVAEATKVGYFLGETYDPENPPESLTIAGYTYGRAFLEEAKDLDYESSIRDYDGPVLILHGNQDYIAPLVFSFWARDRFQDCTLHVIPGGRHGFFGAAELISLNDMTRFFLAQLR